jgi:hypothetical protein
MYSVSMLSMYATYFTILYNTRAIYVCTLQHCTVCIIELSTFLSTVQYIICVSNSIILYSIIKLSMSATLQYMLFMHAQICNTEYVQLYAD